jgi:Flp pilus assembly protein TadD
LNYERGNLLLDIGSAEEAVDSFRLAVSIEPDMQVAQHALGEALHAAGRLVEAQEALKIAAKLAPHRGETRE